MSYETRVVRLQEIVSDLQRDGLPLDDALRLFEEGIEVLRLASDELTLAEGRVQLLIERADGVFETRDIDA
ncbi:MAG: exodeoxyribonuclease VII small subunit [Gemmatimonadota bacterium]|nr:exodeoxyribonuclease VII small subunit [Gemmatimonadota bacterium]